MEGVVEMTPLNIFQFGLIVAMILLVMLGYSIYQADKICEDKGLEYLDKTDDYAVCLLKGLPDGEAKIFVYPVE